MATAWSSEAVRDSRGMDAGSPRPDRPGGGRGDRARERGGSPRGVHHPDRYQSEQLAGLVAGRFEDRVRGRRSGWVRPLCDERGRHRPRADHPRTRRRVRAGMVPRRREDRVLVRRRGRPTTERDWRRRARTVPGSPSCWRGPRRSPIPRCGLPTGQGSRSRSSPTGSCPASWTPTATTS